jgi:Transposase and inactivated derivatives
MIFKGLKIRLYPTIFQQSLFEFNFGANRFVWNITLDMLIKRHESNRKLTFPTSYDLNYLLVPLKNEYPWLKESESTSLQSTMSNLVKAYQSFFNKKHRFPKFKSKKYYKQSYQSKVSNNLRITKKYIFIPKVGMVKYKSGRKIPSKLVSITIRKSSSGKFYAILLSREKIIDFNKTNMNVGLDMGIKNLLTLSNGKKYLQ